VAALGSDVTRRVVIHRVINVIIVLDRLLPSGINFNPAIFAHTVVNNTSLTISGGITRRKKNPILFNSVGLASI
jgi:hypothetical protein